MSDLGRFLRYLDRADVSEIVFESGATANAKQRGRLKPVTREPLTAQHVLKLVRGTPLEKLVPERDGSSQPMRAEIGAGHYVAWMARSGPTLTLRVRRDEPAAAAPPVSESSVEPANPVMENEPAAIPGAQPPVLDRTLPHDIVEIVPERSYRGNAGTTSLAGVAHRSIPVQGPSGLRKLLTHARERGASDLHLMSDEPARVRCGGYLMTEGRPLRDEVVRELVLPLLDERHHAQLDERGYADFACEVEGAGRLRVNVSKQRTGIKGCFRLIMEAPPTLQALGMPPELRKMLDYHQGLVVVSGPSGAGKTTTLAALVDLFNTEKAVHIITVEDPVELIHPIKKAIVTQREVGAHTKSFHSALKGSLREDPDVIAIGELRDRETVEKALEAAETGHLVFATMSTPNGASTIDRLIDMFPPDDQSQVRATLAGALKFVVSQRLVARADGTGQVAAVELLTGGMALWSLIRDDKLFQLPSLLQRGRGFGMIRVEDSLNALVASGVITEASARQYADDARMIEHKAPAPAQRGRRAQPDRPARKAGARGLFSKRGS